MLKHFLSKLSLWGIIEFTINIFDMTFSFAPYTSEAMFTSLQLKLQTNGRMTVGRDCF